MANSNNCDTLPMSDQHAIQGKNETIVKKSPIK